MANKAFAGRYARVVYGAQTIEATRWRLSLAGNVIDTTDLSVFRGEVDQPFWLGRQNPVYPPSGFYSQGYDFVHYGTPRLLTYGGIRQGSLELSGICTVDSRTPHLGTLVQILLSNSYTPGFGDRVFTGLVGRFETANGVREFLSWSSTIESSDAFDVSYLA